MAVTGRPITLLGRVAIGCDGAPRAARRAGVRLPGRRAPPAGQPRRAGRRPVAGRSPRHLGGRPSRCAHRGPAVPRRVRARPGHRAGHRPAGAPAPAARGCHRRRRRRAGGPGRRPRAAGRRVGGARRRAGRRRRRPGHACPSCPTTRASGSTGSGASWRRSPAAPSRSRPEHWPRPARQARRPPPPSGSCCSSPSTRRLTSFGSGCSARPATGPVPSRPTSTAAPCWPRSSASSRRRRRRRCSAAATAPAARLTGGAPIEHASAFDGLSVLVVEDHDFQRRTAVMLLRRPRHRGRARSRRRRRRPRPARGRADARRHRVRPRHARHGRHGVHPTGRGGEARRGRDHRQRARRQGDQGGPLGERELRAAGPRGDGEAADRRVASASCSPPTAPASVAVPRLRGRRRRPADAVAAVRDGRITFHLRPAVDVATGGAAAALLVPRWLEPGRAEVAPRRFLAALEQAGALGPLGDRAAAAASCAPAHARGVRHRPRRSRSASSPTTCTTPRFADRPPTDGSDPSRLDVLPRRGRLRGPAQAPRSASSPACA